MDNFFKSRGIVNEVKTALQRLNMEIKMIEGKEAIARICRDSFYKDIEYNNI